MITKYFCTYLHIEADERKAARIVEQHVLKTTSTHLFTYVNINTRSFKVLTPMFFSMFHILSSVICLQLL